MGLSGQSVGFCVCVRLSVKCTGQCVYAGVGAFCYHSPLQILTELDSYSE